LIAKLRWLAVGSLFMAGLAGCGLGPAGVTVKLARAGNQTMAARTAEATVTVTYPAVGGDPPITLEGSGVVDFRQARARYVTTGPGGGGETIQDGATVYVKLGPELSALADGAWWMRVDLAKDPSRIAGDHTQAIGALAEAGSASKVGDEVIDGGRVTHYQFDVPSERVLPGISGGEPIPMEAWIDKGGRTRRLRMIVDDSRLRLPGVDLSLPAGDTVITTSFSNFGVRADIEPPPVGETISLADLDQLRSEREPTLPATSPWAWVPSGPRPNAQEAARQAEAALGPAGSEPSCLSPGSLTDSRLRSATVNPLDFAGTGRLAPPPLPVPERPEVLGIRRHATPEEYVTGNPGVIEPEERMAGLRLAGFTGAVTGGQRQGRGTSSFFILRFASPEGAAAYHRLHLGRVCSEAVDPRVVSDLPGGVAYLRPEGGDTPAKVSFVVGDTEVNLAVCGCMAVEDTLALIENWGRAVLAQLTRPTPA